MTISMEAAAGCICHQAKHATLRMANHTLVHALVPSAHSASLTGLEITAFL